MIISIASLIFFAVVCLIFFNIRQTLRTRFLVVSGLVYAFLLSPYAGAVVLIVSVLTWLMGMLIGRLHAEDHPHTAAVMTGGSAAAAVLLLLAFKFVHPLQTAGILPEDFRWILPVGFSFYSFQVISYLVDINTGRTEAIRSLWEVLLWLCWFPKFISGPIERAKGFSGQIRKMENTTFRGVRRWKKVVSYVLVGSFYKIVIADRLGVFADRIFDEYSAMSSSWLLLGVLFYTIQIYCDFAGYSYVAVGISAAFDIDLATNFAMPYCSANITEFWRRWHISLSSWLRDYLYIPLGGNRRGEARKYLNVLIVFLVCGLWHGIGTGFLVWGLLHGFYSALDSFLDHRNIQKLRQGIPGRLLTFAAVSAAWIFFRFPTARAALRYIRAMLTTGPRFHSFRAEMAAIGMKDQEARLIVFLILVMAVMDITAYRKKCAVPEILRDRHYVIRYTAVLLLMLTMLVFGMYGPAFDSRRLIYMQF